MSGSSEYSDRYSSVDCHRAIPIVVTMFVPNEDNLLSFRHFRKYEQYRHAALLGAIHYTMT